jgi:translation initiation factor 2-alpha kinase 4
MTGKAAGAWNKPPIKLPQKKDNTSFPGLAPASASSPEVATKVEYEERQRDEVLALEAIYGEDFVKHTQTHSVWKVCPSLLSTPVYGDMPRAYMSLAID